MEHKEYLSLISIINYANDMYYKKSKPIMSDIAFDNAMNAIIEYERQNPTKIDQLSPTQHVGNDLTGTNVMKHIKPMLSLENTYDQNDVQSWYDFVVRTTGGNQEIVIEEKLDGCSGSFIFYNGELIKAVTRGNGLVGEDITENMKQLNWNIDKSFTGEVRGEILMTKQEFERLNVNGDYANPRNLVSGTIKLLDINEFKQRQLVVKMYWLESDIKQTQHETLSYLESLGFDVPKYNIARDIDELFSYITLYEQDQHAGDVMIDGAVLKVNSKDMWDVLGTTAKYPRYAKAYKFKQEEVETIVTSIEFQVGRTGKITPCCNFEPVTVDGSTISRCTLNNEDYMNTLDPRIGDTIVVHKAAAIIPEIVSVDITKRPAEAKKVEFIKTCPICGSVLLKDPDKADHFCPNIECEARIQESINHFCHAMEIDGFGPELITKLYATGILTSITDIYTLESRYNNSMLPKIDGIGDKTYLNVIEQINKSKSNDPDMLLMAIGIPGVGKKMAKTLIQHFKSIDNLAECTISDIQKIDGFGDIKSENIYKFMRNQKNLELLAKLKESGLKFVSDTEISTNNKLDGKIFVITGALSITRDAFEKIICDNGGKLSGSVSSKTYALITNTPDSGSSKNKKAKDLGVRVITEAEFYDLL